MSGHKPTDERTRGLSMSKVQQFFKNLKPKTTVTSKPSAQSGRVLAKQKKVAPLNHNSQLVGSVTFFPAEHHANSYAPVVTPNTPSDILKDACPYQFAKAGEILQSSFGQGDREIRPQGHGLVHTIADAYNQHHALVIRPDDVWLAILVQFNFYVNGNAELLRSQFVAHEGKKKLVIEAVGDRYSVDFGNMAHQMTELIQKNVVDPSLREWIMPDFTTTELNDVIVSSVVMMATMKSYFSYEFSLCCGIPKVTLEGDKADWEKILGKLEKLKEYGVQCIAWYHLLVPVISRFVNAYDNPDADENLDFWQKVCHYTGGGSMPTYLCGWVTAFCVWDNDGKWIGSRFKTNDTTIDPLSLSAAEFYATFLTEPWDYNLTLDGFTYHQVESENIPSGFAEVDVHLNDNGEEFDTMMVAGLVGTQISSSGDMELSKTGERDVVKPVSGWWMFIKDEQKQKASLPRRY